MVATNCTNFHELFFFSATDYTDLKDFYFMQIIDCKN